MFQEFNINTDKILHLQENEGRDPSASEIKVIIDTIIKNNIQLLFKEPQFETKLVDSLSSKYNLDVLVLDEDEVQPNSRLIADLGAESIDFLDLVSRICSRPFVVSK